MTTSGLRGRAQGALAAGLLVTVLISTTNCGPSRGVKWAESTAPQVRTNQVGYLPHGPKLATVRAGEPTPLDAELRAGDKVVWTGKTKPFGHDEASGDAVHWLDFSSYEKPQEGLTLHVGQRESYPFRIGDDIYERLTLDALKYFYHNRSGVPIVQPYVEERTHTRPAGHLSDANVPCWIAEDCSYSLDVSGGWYDAGDHGKYVVNGGISAWTLLALYERLMHLSGTASRWGDRTLNIPESGNGAPDLLDEARFEVEFLLKMQVPEGHPLAGMAHHKIHDNAWTPLALEPPSEAEHRALHPPSTAATLNLAAVAAQAGRLFRLIDEGFAERCLSSAKRAYEAALAHPERFAPELDRQGGGPYADKYVSDEFYWAEAELFLTTGDKKYLEALRARPEQERFPTRLHHPDGGADGDGVTSSMTWQSTAGLGWISLAVVPSSLSEAERSHYRRGITDAAGEYLKVIEGEGYRLPLGLGAAKKYPWGSNSFVLNNMIVLSLAYDFGGGDKYARGVAEGMDYILGRNPMAQSYVTGYGTNPLTQPHHRFWAHAINPAFPKPPRGAVSGGPNSSLQDPQTKRSGLSVDLPPQKCFVDHIDAWSVNEITINWNAPLAWVALFLDEWGSVARRSRDRR